MDSLDKIRKHIESGDRERAERELGWILQADPKNGPAWGLLAALLEDPARKADCYRQILQINPQDAQAAARLRALTDAPSESELDGQPILDAAAVLRCHQCGGEMEVSFVGTLRDKRAICLHCGTKVDLPDAYQRVERKRQKEKLLGGSRVTDEVTVETRIDQLSDDAIGQLPPEFKELREQLRRGEPPDDGTIQELRDQGFVVKVPEDPATEAVTIRKPVSSKLEADVFTSVDIAKEPGRLAELLDRFGMDELPAVGSVDVGRRILQPGSERPEDIVAQAGGALPPEQRRNCPECDAVVATDAARCPWCGAAMANNGGP